MKLRTYKFEFSCLLRKSTHPRRHGEPLVHGFLEGAHFFVEVDFESTANTAGDKPQFDDAADKLYDVIDRRFEGCPILDTPLGIDDPTIASIEALTRGRVYLMRGLTSDHFAEKFGALFSFPDCFVRVAEVRVMKAGDDFASRYVSEYDDEDE